MADEEDKTTEVEETEATPAPEPTSETEPTPPPATEEEPKKDGEKVDPEELPEVEMDGLSEADRGLLKSQAAALKEAGEGLQNLVDANSTFFNEYFNKLDEYTDSRKDLLKLLKRLVEDSQDEGRFAEQLGDVFLQFTSGRSFNTGTALRVFFAEPLSNEQVQKLNPEVEEAQKIYEANSDDARYVFARHLWEAGLAPKYDIISRAITAAKEAVDASTKKVSWFIRALALNGNEYPKNTGKFVETAGDTRSASAKKKAINDAPTSLCEISKRWEKELTELKKSTRAAANIACVALVLRDMPDYGEKIKSRKAAIETDDENVVLTFTGGHVGDVDYDNGVVESVTDLAFRVGRNESIAVSVDRRNEGNQMELIISFSSFPQRADVVDEIIAIAEYEASRVGASLDIA